MSPFSLAAELTQPAIYVRCYSQFARSFPGDGDRLLTQVKAKKITAADACLKLIETARLDSSGQMVASGRDREIGIRVLKVIQSFHMSWFPNRDFLKEESEDATANLFDSNEMGYHLTYALLGPHVSYSQIVTRNGSFRGRRKATGPVKFLSDPGSSGSYRKISEFKWILGDPDKVHLEWHPKLVDFGTLIGVAPLDPKQNKVVDDASLFPFIIYANASFGGGIIGTAPYILLNTTQPNGKTSDNALIMHRAWAQSVFSDLLCRDLPVLRSRDVEDLVDKSSSLPFRKKVDCMRCHATMDTFASTIANIEELRTTRLSDRIFLSLVLAKYRQDLPASGKGNFIQDPKLHLRPPAGRVFYRSFSGQLVNHTVASVSDIGKVLAKQDDLYVCAAKRYFEFMTGIDVKIRDYEEDPPSEKSGPVADIRNFVIQQGLQLKRSQSLTSLISNILNSKYYAMSDYGTSNEK